MTAAALSSGTYTARTEQSDAAGNVGYSQLTTFAISGVADVTAPVVSLNAPPASSTDTTPTLAGSAGILPGDSATVTVRVFSGTSVAGAQVQALSATRTSGGSYTIDSPALAAGTYTARAEQSRQRRQHRVQPLTHLHDRRRRRQHRPGGVVDGLIRFFFG